MKWTSIIKPKVSEIALISEIDISSKDLQYLPTWINLCCNLKKLICNDNKINQICDTLPTTLKILCFNSNRLESLPDNLPDGIIFIDVDNNLLTELPKLPNELIKLFCANNKIKFLPIDLPSKLERLYVHHNIINYLPEILPPLLILLSCHNNHIKFLPILPNTIQYLYCNNNLLSIFPDNIPSNVIDLIIFSNKLTVLPDNIPRTVINFDCRYNKLKQLPLSIIECRNLQKFHYNNNPLEPLHPLIVRFLSKQLYKDLIVYSDSQSVHNHNIQESIRSSIYNLLKDKIVMDIKTVKQNIKNDSIINKVTKNTIVKYTNDNTRHTLIPISYADLLIPVWQRISKHSNSDEIKQILNQEILSGLNLCFTGKLSRLVSVLDGFYEDISINIGDQEQIGNIIMIIKDNLDRQNNYSIENHKQLVSKELNERSYDQNIINHWISFIE